MQHKICCEQPKLNLEYYLLHFSRICPCHLEAKTIRQLSLKPPSQRPEGSHNARPDMLRKHQGAAQEAQQVAQDLASWYFIFP